MGWGFVIGALAFRVWGLGFWALGLGDSGGYCGFGVLMEVWAEAEHLSEVNVVILPGCRLIGCDAGVTACVCFMGAQCFAGRCARVFDGGMVS